MARRLALVVVAPGFLLQQVLRGADQRVGAPDDLAQEVERARDVERRCDGTLGGRDAGAGLSGVGRFGSLGRGLRCLFIVTPWSVGGFNTGGPLWFWSRAGSGNGPSTITYYARVTSNHGVSPRRRLVNSEAENLGAAP